MLTLIGRVSITISSTTVGGLFELLIPSPLPHPTNFSRLANFPLVQGKPVFWSRILLRLSSWKSRGPSFFSWTCGGCYAKDVGVAWKHLLRYLGMLDMVKVKVCIYIYIHLFLLDNMYRIFVFTYTYICISPSPKRHLCGQNRNLERKSWSSVFCRSGGPSIYIYIYLYLFIKHQCRNQKLDLAGPLFFSRYLFRDSTMAFITMIPPFWEYDYFFQPPNKQANLSRCWYGSFW